MLVVNPDLPPSNRDAGSLRLFRILELLAGEGHQVTLVGRAGIGQEPVTAELAALGIDVFPVDRTRLRELGARIGGPDLDFAALLRSGQFDVAWLSFYETAEQYLPLIRALSPLTRVVIDTVDVHSVRERRAAELTGDPLALAGAERTRTRETAVYAAADALVAVSDVDGAALTELAPLVPVFTIPTVHAAVDPTPGFDGRDGLVFVGSFPHAPNVDAVLEFHRATWPLIKQVRPATRLTLVGNSPPDAVQALAAADIDVPGWVPDVAPYLDRARVSIAPIRYGAGVKGKIGEALGRGLPVVTTSIGAEGMGLVDGEHVLVADDPAGFATAVLRLHDDRGLWDAMRDAGQAYVEERFGIAATTTSLRRVLEAVVQTPFLATAGTPDAQAAISTFATAFSGEDPVSLILTVSEDGPDAATRAFDDAARTLETLGLDPESVADIQIRPASSDLILPGRAVIVGAGAGARSVSGEDSPDRWREFSRLAGRRSHRSHAPQAAILLHAPDDAAALAPQLAALQRAGLSDDVEVVIAADPADERVEALLRGCTGVRVVRGSVPLGRHQAWQLAAQATAAPVAVALSPLAIPSPRFADALIDLVGRGAGLAAPMIGSEAGLRVAADGSLWPRRRDEAGAPDALALDCLAAQSDVFRDGLPVFPRGEGHVETQLAALASRLGPLAVAPDAHVERLTGPDATVIICTRNRAEELPDGIALILASGARDVVIVDNDSTDDTAEVAAELAHRSGGVVRVVSEPRGGLCHARNAGAAAARHELLLYVDDDARVAPGWLNHLSWALARPGTVNAGGPISALWPESRTPGWPGRDLEPLLSVLDLGDAERSLVTPDVVYGANWAVRRDALNAVGGFDPDFGPGPDARINGDEVSVAWRLHRAGLGATVYVPGAAVGHRISPDRIDEDFLVHRAMCVGVERPRHAVALGSAGSDQLLAQAESAASQFAALAPLGGDLTVGEALAGIAHLPVSREHRIAAATSLGELSAAVVLLGETEALLGDLRLRIDRDALLRGVIAATPAAV